MESNKNAYRNVIYSMMGIIFNTIIPIIVFPYVTRVLGVYGIGKYSFYSSIFTYAALFSGFGIALYGSREIGRYADNLQKRSQIFVELMTINLITVAIAALFVIYFAFFSSYSSDSLIIILFSLTLLTNAVGAEWFFVGIEKQGFMLIRNIIIKLISIILIFVFVRTPEDLTLYVAITTFSLAAASITNIYYWIKLVDFKDIISLKLRKYLKPLSSIFSVEVLLRYLGLGDVVILGIIVGDIAVGIYSMGLKVFLLISSVLKVTATTLMPRSTFYLQNHDINSFNNLFNTTIRMLMLIGLPISAGLYLFAEPIILLLGGNQFEDSIDLMKEMSFLLLLGVIINTYVFQAFYPQNKVRAIILAHVVGVVSNIILNIILIPFLSYQGTFIAFAVSNITIAAVLVLLEKDFFKHTFSIREYKNYIYSTAISFTIAFICTSTFNGLYSIISMIVFILIYLLTLYWLKDKLFINTISSIFKVRK